MNFLIIGDGTNNDTMENKNIELLNHDIQNNKKVFLFTFMEGCGPCNSTKPQWDNMEKTIKQKYNDNICVARVNNNLFYKLKNVGNEPMGYPSLRYVTKNGIEEYEDCNLLTSKDRTTESFLKWIEHKTANDKSSLKTHSKSHHKSHRRKSKSQKGGKWTLKYKKSINCKKPKGFSQKQYCKYGRKNSKIKKSKK